MAEFKDRLELALSIRNMKPAELAKKTGIGEGAISQYRKGAYKATQRNLEKISSVLNCSIPWLMGVSDDISGQSIKGSFHEPKITEDYVTFPVVGEVAAGYEHIIQEEWDGDTINIPIQYLHGHPKSDFIVLTICGNSMYPLYLEGDKVLIIKQQTLSRSGEIGLVRYDGECATLKKVEYVSGEDWIKLIPLNPEYPPKTIKGPDLEECEIIGVPWLLIREIIK